MGSAVAQPDDAEAYLLRHAAHLMTCRVHKYARRGSGRDGILVDRRVAVDRGSQQY